MSLNTSFGQEHDKGGGYAGVELVHGTRSVHMKERSKGLVRC